MDYHQFPPPLPRPRHRCHRRSLMAPADQTLRRSKPSSIVHSYKDQKQTPCCVAIALFSSSSFLCFLVRFPLSFNFNSSFLLFFYMKINENEPMISNCSTPVEISIVTNQSINQSIDRLVSRSRPQFFKFNCSVIYLNLTLKVVYYLPLKNC